MIGSACCGSSDLLSGLVRVPCGSSGRGGGGDLGCDCDGGGIGYDGGLQSASACGFYGVLAFLEMVIACWGYGCCVLAFSLTVSDEDDWEVTWCDRGGWVRHVGEQGQDRELEKFDRGGRRVYVSDGPCDAISVPSLRQWKNQWSFGLSRFGRPDHRHRQCCCPRYQMRSRRQWCLRSRCCFVLLRRSRSPTSTMLADRLIADRLMRWFEPVTAPSQKRILVRCRWEGGSSAGDQQAFV